MNIRSYLHSSNELTFFLARCKCKMIFIATPKTRRVKWQWRNFYFQFSCNLRERCCSIFPSIRSLYVDLEIGSNKKQIEFGVNWRFCWGQKPFVSSHVQKSEVATADWQRKLARLVSANRQDVFYCRDQILLRVLRRGRTESMNQDLAMLGRRYLPFTAIWINLCIIVMSFPNFSVALLKVKIGMSTICMSMFN